ncbi:MAG: ABC-F family ATP-binding cassette domain-containing protein [Acidobacteriota bacterium]
MSDDLLLSCQELARAHGGKTLFSGLGFGIREGERIGLVGPNGAGKSTLLRTLVDDEQPEAGRVTARRLLRLGFVPQSTDYPQGLSAEDAVLERLGDLGLAEHELAGRASSWLGRAGFVDFAQEARTLSGGWQKRLSIVRELAREPELLVLDEPTNHLDIEGILWLEEILVVSRRALLVVSHDRWFLQNVATKMMELSPTWPTGLFVAAGGYADFLEKREEARLAQESRETTLANQVRREVEWLRRGPKARTTKAKARIDEAGRLQDELASVKERNRTIEAGIDLSASGRKTKRLLDLHGVSKSLGDRSVLDDVSLPLTRGARVGIIGANGSGKTTLLRLLEGGLEPDTGRIERAPHLKVVHFEQDRASLDPSISLQQALSPTGDTVLFRGQQVHVSGWAQRFLFRTEQLPVSVGQLSGGERSRILLARMMLLPADVLLLDEPTNDLDIATLEVLEQSLLDFPGALVLVTHDRFLLDRVATSVVAVEPGGCVTTYADLAQWEAAKRASSKETSKVKKADSRSERKGTGKKKLSYHEQREFDGMEQAILEAEERLSEAESAAADPGIASDPAALQERHSALAEAQAAVETLYARWAELEAKVAPPEA